ELADGRVGPGGAGQLDVRLGDLEERLLDTLGLHRLAVGDRGAEDVPVPADGGLEVLDGDGDVVDLREEATHPLGVLAVLLVDEAHAPCLRKRVILSSPTLARNSGSSIPSPSSGARQSTPILPSC